MARTATAKKATTDTNSTDSTTTADSTNNTTKPSWSVLGNFYERFYTNAYFGLKDVWGKTCRAYLKDEFDWDEFNQAFAEVFGEADERRWSAQDLHDTAVHIFYLGFKDLVKRNLDNLKKRKQYTNSQSSKNQTSSYDEQF